MFNIKMDIALLNLIFKALGKMPFEESAGAIGYLKTQADQQVKENENPKDSAVSETSTGK
jgi:hypothetical protein